MQDMKLRHNYKVQLENVAQFCTGGKWETRKCGRVLQGWKMREILLWQAKNSLLCYQSEFWKTV